MIEDIYLDDFVSNLMKEAVEKNLPFVIYFKFGFHLILTY